MSYFTQPTHTGNVGGLLDELRLAYPTNAGSIVAAYSRCGGALKRIHQKGELNALLVSWADGGYGKPTANSLCFAANTLVGTYNLPVGHGQDLPYKKYPTGYTDLQRRLNVMLKKNGLCPLGEDGSLGPNTCAAAAWAGAIDPSIKLPAACLSSVTPDMTFLRSCPDHATGPRNSGNGGGATPGGGDIISAKKKGGESFALIAGGVIVAAMAAIAFWPHKR